MAFFENLLLIDQFMATYFCHQAMQVILSNTKYNT